MILHEILSDATALENKKTVDGCVFAQIAREQFANFITELVNTHGLRLVHLYATDDRLHGGVTGARVFTMHAIIAHDVGSERLIITTELPELDPSYPSVTRTVMAAHWYERYAADMFGVVPVGHPDPRRLVHHENVPEGTHPLRKDFLWNTKMDHANEPYPMHHVEGEGIYEIPVGPIHAGIIEPGHFRFNVAGERIITLEGKLFFTHKGIEKIIEGKSATEALSFIERISCDAAASHALAFSLATEMVTGCRVSDRASRLRVLICELERITMHIHDLGNIVGNGTGYTFMAAQGFRVKERMVELSARLCGNRFWRGLIVPGGLTQDITGAMLSEIEEITVGAVKEMNDLLAIALASDGLRERLETTGILWTDGARALGALGLAARASGVDIDVRRDFPYAAYSDLKFAVSGETSGDVYARYCVRIVELQESLEIVRQICEQPGSGALHIVCIPKDGFGFGVVESWRGEIITAVHFAHGVITRCAPRDPSFCNWALFGLIGPGNIVPDFPLCNKTLNLSYSGTDL